MAIFPYKEWWMRPSVCLTSPFVFHERKQLRKWQQDWICRWTIPLNWFNHAYSKASLTESSSVLLVFQQKEHGHSSPARIDWGWGRSPERRDASCWRLKTRRCWLADQLNRPIVAERIPARVEKMFKLIHQHECFLSNCQAQVPCRI